MNSGLSASRPLADRKIILGVTGSIAGCKADRIIRELQDRGAEVQVLLTDSGQKYFTPEIAGALTNKPVLTQAYQDSHPEKIVHIDAIQTADCILVAPATANRLLELDEPTADDLFSTILYAFDGPVFYAPAMNDRMWENPRCQQVVEEYSDLIISPEAGPLACGTTGPGRLASPARIAGYVAARLWPDLLADRRWAITGGPTREAWDEIRYLSNRASGRMGEALALVGSMLGAQITYVTGQQNRHYPVSFCDWIRVNNCREMLAKAETAVEAASGFIGAAAVADYRPRSESGKVDSGQSDLTIDLECTPDIISTLREQNAESTFVGFAAQSELNEAAARDKLENKQLDAIAVNETSRAGSKQGRLVLLTAGQDRWDLGQRSKLDLALQLWLALLENDLA